MKVNVSIQIIPRVKEERVYEVVDKVIDRIAASGLVYEVGPMETTIEGELEEIFPIIQDAQNICIESGATRVASMIKIDYKPGGVTIEEKVGKYRK